MREQQHVADRGLVGEQHHHAVDADAEPGGRRQAVLQRAHVVRVVEHRFLVAGALARHLLAEPGGLVVGIVQLGESVRQLAPADEELEAVGDERVRVVAPRERRDFRRVGIDEGRLGQAVLRGLLEDLDLQLAGTVRGVGLDPEPRADLPQVIGIPQPRPLDARVEVHHEVLDRHAAERGAEIVGLSLVGNPPRAEHRVRDALEDALDQVHQVAVIRVGLVELQHRELGVVLRRETLVAEIAVDLVHALEAAHDQALQEELRRDAQVHVQVERVVMSHERTCHGTARYDLHHRRLDFHEVQCVEEAPQVLDDPRSRAEHRPALLVYDQVHVALPVALLDVGQPVPLVRQRTQRLDQQSQPFDAHRQLSGPGLEQHALGAQHVADVPALESLVDLAERIALQEELDLAAAILELREARLAHHPLEQHAARDRDTGRVGFEPLVGPVAVGQVQLLGGRIPPEVVGKGVPLVPQPLELGAPFGDQVVDIRCSVLFAHLRTVSTGIPLLQSLLQARLEERVEVAVEHGGRVADLHAGAQVLDP